jgi:membrane protein
VSPILRRVHRDLAWFQRQIDQRRILGLASEVAFWLFLSILPLAAVAAMAAAKIVVARHGAFDALLGAVHPAMRTYVSSELGRVAAWKGGAVGPVAAVTFLWLASSGVHGLFDAFEAMGHVTRPWWKKRALAIIACVLLSIGVAVVSVLAIGVERMAAFLQNAAPFPGWLESAFGRAVRVGVGGAVAFGMIAGLYALGNPRPAGRRRLPVLPGALFATVASAVLAYGYALVVRLAGDSGAYLAGLATIAVSMTFVYLYALAILLGYTVNQWWRLRHRIPRALGMDATLGRSGGPIASPSIHRSHRRIRLPCPSPNRFTRFG